MFGILAKFFRFSGKENGNKCAGRFYICNKKGSGMGKIGNHSSKRNHTKGGFFFLRMVEIKK